MPLVRYLVALSLQDSEDARAVDLVVVAIVDRLTVIELSSLVSDVTWLLLGKRNSPK